MSKTYFVESIKATAGLGGKLFLTQYESISPYYSGGAEIRTINSVEEYREKQIGKELTAEELQEEIQELQTICRRACEAKIDEDILDIKGVNLFQEVLKAKSKRGKN